VKYSIAIVVTVEAQGPEQALANARALKTMLADPFVQSSLRSEGIDARGIEVKPPAPSSTDGGSAG